MRWVAERGRLSRHTLTRGARWRRERGMKSSGGGPSVGETADPGSASRAACPTIRSLRLGCVFAGSYTFGSFSFPAANFFARYQTRSRNNSVLLFFLPPFRALSARSSNGTGFFARGKSGRAARTILEEHVHPCEREPKSWARSRGRTRAPLSPSWKLALPTSNRLVLEQSS